MTKTRHKFPLRVVLGLLLLTIGISSLPRQTQIPSKSQESLPWPTTTAKSLSPFLTPAPSAQPDTLPTYSQNPPLPRQIFDTSSWTTFDYPQVGLKFKYPPSWGTPSTTLDPPSNTHHGYHYHVSFPRSNFTASGISPDFDAGREFGWQDFSGWGPNRHYKDSTSLCQLSPLLFCQATNSQVHLLASTECSDYPYPFHYYRLMFSNTSGKLITGISLGGYFLPDEYYSSLFNWACNDSFKKDLDSAILERRLDAKSQFRFDEFEKVFETVEIY